MEGGQDFRIKEGGGLRVFFVELAGFAPARPNGVVGALEDVGVVAVFPFHQLADDIEQLLATDFSGFFVDAAPKALADLIAGIVHHLREDHGAGGGERPSCPPQMDAARMCANAGHLFVCTGLVDVIQRQGDFDQFFRDVDGVHGADPSGGRLL